MYKPGFAGFSLIALFEPDLNNRASLEFLKQSLVDFAVRWLTTSETIARRNQAVSSLPEPLRKVNALTDVFDLATHSNCVDATLAQSARELKLAERPIAIPMERQISYIWISVLRAILHDRAIRISDWLKPDY